MSTIICRHTHCCAAQYDSERRSFKTIYIRSKHEKNVKTHHCPDITACEACQMFKFVQKGLDHVCHGRKFKCRHSGCKKRYKLSRDRWNHEENHTHNPLECAKGNCKICRKKKTAGEIPDHIPETIAGVKRKLDSLDSNTYLNLPMAKKQRLLKEADQAIIIASVNDQKFVIDLSQEEMARLTSGHQDVDIDELLALKDDLCVPDAKWSSVVHVMRLSDKCTIYHIRKRRAVLDKTMGSIVQTKGNGCQQDLQEVLKWMLQKNAIDPNIPVRIKFAFDGARITMKQKQSQVVGTVEVLSGKSVQEIKSSTNAHQWIIYVGDESNEDLKKELIDALPTIQEIFRDNSLKIGDTTYLMDPYLVCDMPLLEEVLGLYKVHHPKSKFRCTHCHVTADKLHCWTIEQWPMRSIDDLIKYGAIADERPSEAARKTFAGQNFGVKASPVLAIPLTRCPPCYLHTVQALVRLLWSQIVYSAEMDQKIAEKAVLFLTDSVNMTLPNIKDQKKKKFKKDGTERAPTKKLTKEVKMLKKTKFAYPDSVRLLENHRELIDMLLDIGMDKDENAQLKELWEQLYGLLLLATNPQTVPEGSDIEQVWRDAARTFAENFCLLYESEDVTPYLHQFVYHLGYFLKTCGSLETLANFAIEGKHRQNKRTIRAASSGQSRKGNLENAQYQQIARTTRLEALVDKLPARKKSIRETDWKSVGLKKNEWLKKILTIAVVPEDEMQN